MKYAIHITEQFDKWHSKLEDKVILSRIDARIDRLKHGNFGDSKNIAKNLFELRFTFGSGIKIYYTIRNQQILLLLTGGNKSTQSKDIKTARKILDEL